jgi:hypothetical protein
METSEMIGAAKSRQPGGRHVRVRCVRAISGGQSGWLVRWIDYGQPVWRQCRFFRIEREAQAFARSLRVPRDVAGRTAADAPYHEQRA